EDNDVNLKLTTRILQKQRHTVIPAANGKEALALLEQQQFDVVLMDLQMPEMGGIEATKQLRERERGTRRRVPIIALTAHAMVGDRERCLQAGMDEYVTKPIRSEELCQAIQKVVPSDMADTGSTNGAPPNDTVIDREAVLARVGQDIELLAEVTEIFWTDYPRLLAEIREAIERGDAAQLAKAAHSLKGAVSNFSASAAFDAARQLETIGQSGNVAGAAEAVAKLDAEISRLQPALAELTASAAR